MDPVLIHQQFDAGTHILGVDMVLLADLVVLVYFFLLFIKSAFDLGLAVYYFLNGVVLIGPFETVLVI